MEFDSDKGMDIRVIEYRLNKILGKLTISRPQSDLEKITYTVPYVGDGAPC